MTDANKSTRAAVNAVSGANESGAQKQKRALLTRKQLIRAARSIFVRDGFENARIADIAASAGKTRGAFYDHFKDKEDVFFALFEEDLEHAQLNLRPMLRTLNTLEERLDAFTQHLVEKSQDRQRTLLTLEFKVYAIRHPRRRKRLADLHAAMCVRFALPEIAEVLPELREPSLPLPRAKSLTLGALLDGLALNHLFDPGGLDEVTIKRQLALGFREALGLPPA